MATTKPRIALVRDDELDRALTRTRDLLSPESVRSTASQVRALALLGAKTIEGNPEVAGRAALDLRLAARYGVRPPEIDGFGDLALGEPDPEGLYAGTEALEWVRGHR